MGKDDRVLLWMSVLGVVLMTAFAMGALYGLQKRVARIDNQIYSYICVQDTVRQPDGSCKNQER